MGTVSPSTESSTQLIIKGNIFLYAREGRTEMEEIGKLG